MTMEAEAETFPRDLESIEKNLMGGSITEKQIDVVTG